MRSVGQKVCCNLDSLMDLPTRQHGPPPESHREVIATNDERLGCCESLA